MAKSVTLARHLTLETMQVEEMTGLDGQGKPSYNTPVDVDARITREDKLSMRADGSYVKTNLTAWVPADAAIIPDEQYRVTYASIAFIVEMVKDVKNRNAELVHRRLRCRRE